MKPRAFVLCSFLSLFAALCPPPTRAILTPVTSCGWSGGTSNTTGGCSIATSANQIVVVVGYMVHTGITAMTCTGGGLTWHTDSFGVRSDGAVGEGICSALSAGTSSVTVTTTWAGSSGANLTDTWIGTFPSTTKIVDSECHHPPGGTIGASPLTGCAVTTSATADMIISFVTIDKFLTSSSYDTLQIVTGSFAGFWGAFGITSGAPGSSTATYTFTGGSGSIVGVNTVAYKLSTSGAAGRVHHRVIQDDYRVPRHREPILLGAILPIWLRRKELAANEC